MTKIDIKPMSVNACWQGRRFKTPDYKAYEIELMYLLPKLKAPSGELNLYLELGLSSKLADIDNPLKPLIDILQKKYEFNDRQIKYLSVLKEKVNKGKEYIKFDIRKY